MKVSILAGENVQVGLKFLIENLRSGRAPGGTR